VAGGAGMTRLVVLTTPELAAGYRLAGVAVREVVSPAEAAAQLVELLDREDGVIALHAPYFHALARPLRRRLEALRTPLVVALPAGSTPEEAEDHRERLLRMLRQAVGYEITFRDETRSQ
jgi:vacuolar-type H+-ATPase subunit F/Vma7